MSSSSDAKQLLSSIELDEKDFIELLDHAIGNAEKLQNHPPELIPQEDLMADKVVEFLAPYSGDNGPLEVRKVTYKKGRSNVIVKYPGSAGDEKVLSFVGSHMDVVPANAEEWKRNPFQLIQEGDKLYGRGVTDCLGHVCLLTAIFKQLAVKKPALERSVLAVFIANEEASEELGIGIDELEKQGELAYLKNGPLYWVDSADIGPTLGTGGVVCWSLTFNGKKFHSGVPQNAINPIEMAMEGVKAIQTRFYNDFNKYAEKEKVYKYNVPSSMKPTQWITPPGSLNQIPGSVTVQGDIRFTPFYHSSEVIAAIEKYVKELDVTTLPSLGASKFHLPDEDLKGTVELKWLGHPYEGVAVDVESPGYKALFDGIKQARGKVEPFALTGSLPIIRDLADNGYDIQITGFGKMAAYHACDEYASMEDFKSGARVVCNVIANLN